jgi:hypothetical protein
MAQPLKPNPIAPGRSGDCSRAVKKNLDKASTAADHLGVANCTLNSGGLIESWGGKKWRMAVPIIISINNMT